jgi:hypothetical protein
MGARNRVGIGLSFRPARLNRRVELIPWNRFLGSINVLKVRALYRISNNALKCCTQLFPKVVFVVFLIKLIFNIQTQKCSQLLKEIVLLCHNLHFVSSNLSPYL